MCKKTSILILIDKLNVGGAERMFVNHVNWFVSNEKYELHPVIYGDEGNLDLFLEKSPIYLRRTGKLDIGAAITLKRLMSESNIVHCHSRHVYKYAKVVSLFMRKKPLFILHDHFGSIENELKLPFIYSHTLKSNYYIGVCDKMVRNASSYGENRFLLRNAVDNRGDEITGQRNKLFVSIGNIKPIKNQRFAIEIASTLRVELCCVGQIQDEEYKKHISSDFVQFYHNFRSGADALCKFKPIIGLHTSISESGPLVLAEYAATGTPFVSYNTGDIAKLFALYIPELILSDFKMKNWIEAIENVLDNYEYYQKRVKEVFESHLTREVFAMKLDEIYKKIV